MSFTKCRYVCFTSFKETAPTFGDGLQYLVFQRERAATGREHWQGYAESSAASGWAVKRWQTALGDRACHVERRKGTAAQADAYCRKEESRVSEPVSFGELAQARGGGSGKAASQDAFRRALASDGLDAAMALLAETVPDEFCKNYTQITKALTAWFAPKKEPYEKPASYTGAWLPTEEMKRWLREEFTKEEGVRAKMLVLVGPTQLGKTAWARSVARHIFWRGAVNLKDWDDEAKLIIIDDIDWQWIPSKKQLLCNGGQACLNGKYMATKTVVQNKKVIYCCNEAPEWTESEREFWLPANAVVVHVHKKLYSTLF